MPLILAVPFLRALQGEQASEVALRIILVRSLSQAQEVFQRLGDGVPFEVVARKDSIDPSAAEGGYLGRVRLSDLRPELRNALKGVQPGQVTQPVETPAGYMIIKVLTDAERLDIESAERGRKLAAAAPGNFRYVTDISGFAEVDGIMSRLPKPVGWDQDLRAICEIRQQAISTGVQQFEGYLAAAGLREPSDRRIKGLVSAHYALAQLSAYQGKLDKAAEHYQTTYQLAQGHVPVELQLDLEEKLGLVYLHRSWLENAVPGNPAPSCILPMPPDPRYKRTGAAENAIKHFLRYLDRDPVDLEVKWLLNIAYMMLGKYPRAVPREHLIPPSVFESKEPIGRFTDVARSAGLVTFDMAGGAIIDDFDNDGLLDVVTSSMDACAPLHYFHNNGNGTFTDRRSQAGLDNQLGGLNIVHTDYDNNGCLDLLVLRGGWQFPMRKSLLRNNCDGTFSDVSRESGLAIPATATQTAAWADIDNDGDLDLFVGNENAPSQLFLNKGDTTFVDIARAAGVDRIAFTKAVVAGDYDNDGYPDFYVSNLRGENFLYHNNHNRTFTEVARHLRVEMPLVSFPAWFFDYDNDGWLDLFVTSYYTSDVEVLRSYLQLPVRAETLKLYRNTGRGSFEDVTQAAGLDRVFMPMGANFGDVDNDGFLDFYLGTGNPSFGALVPDVLFRNRAGKSFVDITAASGTGCLHKGHGIAFADIDHDGDQDVFIQVGGAVLADRHASMLFNNPGNGNRWINIRLEGVKTNRAALGARIKLTLEAEDGRRQLVHRVVGGGGSFGESPFQQHIGLGKAARIQSLEIWWPTSNTRQVFENVPTNQFIEVKEFAKEFARLKRPSFSLGGKSPGPSAARAPSPTSRTSPKASAPAATSTTWPKASKAT